MVNYEIIIQLNQNLVNSCRRKVFNSFITVSVPLISLIEERGKFSMMNFIWGGLMLASILCALAAGRMGELSGAVLSGAADAIQLVISMLGKGGADGDFSEAVFPRDGEAVSRL